MVLSRATRYEVPRSFHIFETFHEGWEYQPRLNAVLKHYKAWAGEP